MTFHRRPTILLTTRCRPINSIPLTIHRPASSILTQQPALQEDLSIVTSATTTNILRAAVHRHLLAYPCTAVVVVPSRAAAVAAAAAAVVACILPPVATTADRLTDLHRIIRLHAMTDPMHEGPNHRRRVPVWIAVMPSDLATAAAAAAAACTK